MFEVMNTYYLERKAMGNADNLPKHQSVDYDTLAKSAGDLVVAVICGIDPDTESIQRFSTNVITVNTNISNPLGYTIPTYVLAGTKYILP